MNLDLTDWAFGLGGGLLIGLSSALYLLLNGRIAGISGIIGGMLTREATAIRLERIAFIAGVIGAPIVYALVAGAPEITSKASTVVLVVAGLLVGYGVRMGSGCASGHGVCGLSRFSVRSLASVVTFLTAGVVTVSLINPIIGG